MAGLLPLQSSQAKGKETVYVPTTHRSTTQSSFYKFGPFISFAEYGEWTVFFSPINPGLPALREGTLKPLLLHRYISNVLYKAFFCVFNLHFSE